MAVVSMGRVRAAPDQFTVQANSCQEGLVEPRGDGERAAPGPEAPSSPPCSLVREAAWESHNLQV